MSAADETSSETTNPTIRVFECGPEDRAEQVELFNACFKKRVDERALAWRYDENPHGMSATFVQRPPNQRAISGYACSPRLVVSHGDRANARLVGETGDVMTHPDWRKKGLFSELDRAAIATTAKRGWVHVFGLPNRKSAHIFLKLGWSQVGTIRPWTFVVKNDAAAREVRAREGRIAGWSTLLAARRAQRGLSTLRAHEHGLAAVGGVVRPLTSFPEEVGALSHAVEAGFAWMVRRDAAYLNWRFFDAPSRAFEVLGAFDAHGKFAGYVVLQGPRAGEPIGHLVDVLATDDQRLSALVLAGLERLVELGASVVRGTAIDGSWWSEVLQRAGFVPPKPENHLIVIAYVHARENAVARAALDASKWYFTDGDRDDETMG